MAVSVVDAVGVEVDVRVDLVGLLVQVGGLLALTLGLELLLLGGSAARARPARPARPPRRPGGPRRGWPPRPGRGSRRRAARRSSRCAAFWRRAIHVKATITTRTATMMAMIRGASMLRLYPSTARPNRVGRRYGAARGGPGAVVSRGGHRRRGGRRCSTRRGASSSSGSSIDGQGRGAPRRAGAAPRSRPRSAATTSRGSTPSGSTRSSPRSAASTSWPPPAAARRARSGARPLPAERSGGHRHRPRRDRRRACTATTSCTRSRGRTSRWCSTRCGRSTTSPRTTAPP